ncbi:DUF2786 domain-containing protein [Nakamurella silvestris]|nr:DUF2786 domain-containing protein [Nakamurella silvestris]
MAHPKKKHKNKVAKPSPHRRTSDGRTGGTPPRSADPEPAAPEATVEPAVSGPSGGHGTDLTGTHQQIPDTELLTSARAVLAAVGSTRRALSAAIAELAARVQNEPTGHRRLDVVFADLVAVDLVRVWEDGWQPLDVAHVAKRNLKARGGQLAAAMILDEAERASAARRAPAAWNDQLTALADLDSSTRLTLPPGTPALSRFAMELGGRTEDTWMDAVEFAWLLRGLPKLPLLLPVPSRWDTLAHLPRRPEGAAGQAPRGAEGVRMLEKVRALLAKAESTEFAAEAETFTAKAQDLMTRHSIDAAMVDGGAATDVHSRRVHVDDPYGEMKAQLVSVIAEVNRARAIWDPRFGMVVLVGEPLDLDLVELLYTSLLIQATRAMTEAGSNGPDHRSPAFRRAFLLAYANRIGERLAQAGSHAVDEAIQEYGAALVPVLAGRAAAVDETFDRMFPNTSRGRSRQVDAQGWHAGRSAADKAALGRPDAGTGRKKLKS